MNHVGVAGEARTAAEWGEAQASRPTRILLPNGERLAGRYEIVALARVLTSHVWAGSRLRRRTEYPARIQFRQYDGPRGAAAADAVRDAAQHIDPDQLLDPTHTSVTGPPLVAAWPTPAHPDALLCVAGNQRCLLLAFAGRLGAAARRGIDRYVLRLRERAADLRLDPGRADDVLGRGDVPLLVRVLERWDRERNAEFPGSPAERIAAFGQINRASDGSFTKALDLLSLAHSLAAEVRAIEGERAPRSSGPDNAPDNAPDDPPAADRRARTPLALLRRGLTDRPRAEYAASARGQTFLDALVAHGAIPRSDAAAYANPTRREPSRAGRAVIEATIDALAFDDPAIDDDAPAFILRAVRRSTAVLLELGQCAGEHAGWNLAARLGDALRLLGRYEEATGVRIDRATIRPGRLEDWLLQQRIVLTDPGDSAAPPNADAAVLALFLHERARGAMTDITDAVDAWRRAARRAGAFAPPTVRLGPDAAQLGLGWADPPPGAPGPGPSPDPPDDSTASTRRGPGRPARPRPAPPPPARLETPDDAFARLFVAGARAQALHAKLAARDADAPARVPETAAGADAGTPPPRGAGAPAPTIPPAELAQRRLYESARDDWRRRTQRPGGRPDRPGRGPPPAHDDDAVVATYALAQRLGLPLTRVAGRTIAGARLPSTRTCRRQLSRLYADPYLRAALERTLRRATQYRATRAGRQPA